MNNSSIQASSWSAFATLTTVFAHRSPTLDPDSFDCVDLEPTAGVDDQAELLEPRHGDRRLRDGQAECKGDHVERVRSVDAQVEHVADTAPAGRRAAARPRSRLWSSPSATSTSSTHVTGGAHSTSSLFVPHTQLRGDPGTAITVTPRSDAALAVIRPQAALGELDDDEHLGEGGDDAVPQREGKSSGGEPGGHSDTSSPLSATHRQMSPFCFGYGRSRPLPTTPTAAPRPT